MMKYEAFPGAVCAFVVFPVGHFMVFVLILGFAQGFPNDRIFRGTCFCLAQGRWARTILIFCQALIFGRQGVFSRGSGLLLFGRILPHGVFVRKGKCVVLVAFL